MISKVHIVEQSKFCSDKLSNNLNFELTPSKFLTFSIMTSPNWAALLWENGSKFCLRFIWLENLNTTEVQKLWRALYSIIIKDIGMMKWHDSSFISLKWKVFTSPILTDIWFYTRMIWWGAQIFLKYLFAIKTNLCQGKHFSRDMCRLI
jgi:hypothetical protein